jgi:ribosomal RNA-processing protein 36
MATDSEDESGSRDGSSVDSEDDAGSSDGDRDESGHDESSSESQSDSHDDREYDHGDEGSSRSSSSSRAEEGRDEDGDNFPVGLKLQRQREAGVDTTDSRKRKARAKEVASERLSSLKAATATTQERRRKEGAAAKEKRAKKKSKHAPTEVSSKRSDFFQRQRMSNVNETGLGVTLAAGYRPKDPRLSSLTGHLDVDKFERNYAFLNEMRDKEIVRLRQRVQAHQTTGSKGRHLRRRLGMTGNGPTTLEEDRAELKRLEQEKADRERSQIDRAARQAVKKRKQEEVEQGKKPHFVSRAKQKQMVLEAKYDELRKRKGEKAVEKAIAKRFKKDKTKLLLPREHA